MDQLITISNIIKMHPHRSQIPNLKYLYCLPLLLYEKKKTVLFQNTFNNQKVSYIIYTTFLYLYIIVIYNYFI